MVELFWGLVQAMAYCVILMWGLIGCILLAALGLTLLIYWRR